MINTISLDYVLMSEHVNLYPWNLEYVLMYMFMSAMYCVCIHNFHSAHICIVYNSGKCVRYSYNQVNS